MNQSRPVVKERKRCYIAVKQGKKGCTAYMEWFLTETELSAWKTREKRLTAAFRILVCLTLIIFIVLCLLVRTENAQAMHAVILAVTALLGWICITVYVLGVKEARTQSGHLDMLQKGEKEFRTAWCAWRWFTAILPGWKPWSPVPRKAAPPAAPPG